MLSERAQNLLKILVERYIVEGQPVGSRALSRFSSLELSPATIRNVMADLEEMGFVTSPHTSAGRVPTPKGYRFFGDTLLQKVRGELMDLHRDISGLMQAAIQTGSEAMRQPASDGVVISGGRNLLEVDELSGDMHRLRRLFDLFEQKTELLDILEVSERAEGVKIFIGGESQLVPLDECSILTAPYEVDGHVVGTLCVIGPTRMAYARVIPIVDVTAKLVTSALSQH